MSYKHTNIKSKTLLSTLKWKLLDSYNLDVSMTDFQTRIPLVGFQTSETKNNSYFLHNWKPTTLITTHFGKKEKEGVTITMRQFSSSSFIILEWREELQLTPPVPRTK